MLTRLVATAAALALAFTLAPPAAAAGPKGHRVKRDQLFGAHHLSLGDGVFPGSPAIKGIRLWDTGTSWRHVNPEPGVFVWDRLDRAIATARAHGARPLIVLGQTPKWAARDTWRHTVYGEAAGSYPADHARWVEYVAALAHRYKGQADYETWNEINLTMYGQLTPAEMVRLQSLAYRTIKRIDPTATVTAPSVTARGGTGGRFLRAFAKAGGFRWADAINVHAYPEPNSGPEVAISLVQGVQRSLRKLGVRKPIWNTEINYGLPWGGNGISEPLTEREQYAYALRTYLLSADAGINRVYWYAWMKAPFLGVEATDGSQGAAGIGAAYHLLRGRFLGCDNRGPKYRCRVDYRKRGVRAVVRWHVDGDGTIRIRHRAL